MSQKAQDLAAMSEHTVKSNDGTTISYHTFGEGAGIVVLGGALRTAEDYLPLATALAHSHSVHVIDRRGRGDSGPQGPEYSLVKEVEDLLAIQAQTGAKWVFGHSYGGLVALEAARTSRVFERIAVYEPGVPTEPVPTQWMTPYRERLIAGDEYGAFAHFLQGSGGAPSIVAKLPHWYLRLALRIGFRGRSWRRMRPLLWANLAEHEQVAAQQGQLAGFVDVIAPTLLLWGSRTVSSAGKGSADVLHETLSDAKLEILSGLDHFGPEKKHAAVVAQRVLAFLSR